MARASRDQRSLAADPARRLRRLGGRHFRDPEFDELGDAEKVKYCVTEVAATLGRLDDMIARLAALRTEVDDPDGLVRFTLGDDGRLLTLYIDDAVALPLTELALEHKLNDMTSAGNEAMRLSRKEFWDSTG
ncbi:MAG TPA: YbaB/EbfC family nucleoid-associated protein [Mycobacterium sp.]|nr:YbaB/EbfC family nucleoid-associated protein [Mycobacterium sp.]